MARVNKFEYVTVLQANYGYGQGWEDIGESVNRQEMRTDIKAYRVNAPEFAYRLIRRRNPITKATQGA